MVGSAGEGEAGGRPGRSPQSLGGGALRGLWAGAGHLTPHSLGFSSFSPCRRRGGQRRSQDPGECGPQAGPDAEGWGQGEAWRTRTKVTWETGVPRKTVHLHSVGDVPQTHERKWPRLCSLIWCLKL